MANTTINDLDVGVSTDASQLVFNEGGFDKKVTKSSLLAEVVKQTDTSGAAIMPKGTTAQRPVTPSDSMFRLNTELNQWEGYKNGEWSGLGGASGGAGNPFMYQHDATVTQDYTLAAGQNAVSAGPITVNSGVTITVESGASWTVVGASS